MANSPSGDSMTERIVRILDTFDTERTLQTSAQIGRRAGLPSSTAHRIVDELVHAGMLERDEDRRVRLGMRLWELALRGSSALRLRQAALPAMQHVQDQLREHTQLAVLEQDEPLFLERLSHPEAGANITRIAGRLPIHASSSGLVLLAFADDEARERILDRPRHAVTAETVTERDELLKVLAGIRRTGHIVAGGTVEEVSTGVAVPVRDDGRVIAALSVVLPRGSATDEAVAVLHRAARSIDAALRASRR